jgi:tetratricopeptide (TPR) repeat protein
LLRALTLFTLPVPEPVTGVLADAVGGSAARLRGLGLLDPYPDLYDPAGAALAASPLAAGRIDPLSAADRAALAGVSAGPLLAAWGGLAPQPGRGLAMDLQLTRLGLFADDPVVTAASAGVGVSALRSGPAAYAFRLGQEAIGLLDRHGHVVPLLLLRQAAQAALTSGDGQAGEALLDRAMRQAETAGQEQADRLGQARVITEQARRMITRGELEQAEKLLRHACQLFTGAGSEREAAAAMGSIADIAYQRGDYDEALRIHREIRLPVYERLGDTRETAVAWGKVADITHQRGDYEEALRIHREIQLPVFERLADTRETAITWGKIAEIRYDRGDYDEALRIHREILLPAFERLGDTRSAAVIWGQIADIAYRRGDHDEALRIRREIQLPVFERLGDTRSATITWGRIADIAYQRGDYDEALRIRREIELPAYGRLGDTRETAITWGKIADIAYQRGDYDEAAELQNKRLEVHKQLGDLDGIAGADWDLAQIDLDRQDYRSAFPRLVESFQIMGRLQRPDGIAAVGITLGQLLMAAGRLDQARDVLSDSLAAATKIGWTDAIQQIHDLLNRPQQ